jgi:hypothetical protein
MEQKVLYAKAKHLDHLIDGHGRIGLTIFSSFNAKKRKGWGCLRPRAPIIRLFSTFEL